MAIRKATQKAQVIEKLQASAPAGETFICTVHGESGPSPFIQNAIVTLTRQYFFFTLTNTSVVVNSANRFTARPGDVVAAFPRAQFPVSRYTRGTIWSKFYVQLPNRKKPTRINVHRYWRAELDQLAAAFPAGVAPIAAS